MIKAVLFDMDETLLDINLEAFLISYQAKLDQILSDISGIPAYKLAIPMTKAYLALSDKNRQDKLTNAQLFNKVIFDETGIPLDDPYVADAIAYFETSILPQCNNALIHGKPKSGAHLCVNKAKDLGLKVGLATNPTFSKNCIACRMKWGEIDTYEMDHITYMENSRRLKPSALYFQQTAQALGLRPEECLMVGNDPKRDICMSDIGMKTAYVGRGKPRSAFWCGSMNDLAPQLEDIIGKIDALGK